MYSTAAPTSRSVKPLYRAALLSSVLLYASFFPLNLGVLAWVALVPLLFLVRASARPRDIYLAVLTCGLAFHVPVWQWIRVAHLAMHATWAALAIMGSVYFVIAIYLIRCLDRRGVPLLLAVPSVWVGLEYFRANFPTNFTWLEPLGLQNRIGFNWYFLGYTQHDCVPIIQIADMAGVFGVSLLVVLVNTAIYLWVARALAPTPVASPRPWLTTAITALLVACTLAYGYDRLDHPPLETGPRVALLQCNLPQEVKMTAFDQVDDKMFDLLRKAKNVPRDAAPDLVVWPETTSTAVWFEVAPGVDRYQKLPEWKKLAEEMGLFDNKSERPRCNQLLGLTSLERDDADKIWKFNSAKFIGKDGDPGPRYDKMHLVPFGEYVPLVRTFPWLQMFTPYPGEYSCKPGEHWTRFPLAVGDKTYQFAVIICYESSDPTLARNYVRLSSTEPTVDFLVNISNDGWFDGTAEHEQHFAICRFRAIECRRSIVRAVNMGISGIIDSDGRVVVIPGETWSASKKIASVVTGQVPIDRRDAFYPQWGDWLPLVCWGIVLAGLIVPMLRRARVMKPDKDHV